MIRYRVTHRTLYRYSHPAPLCHNEAFLTPRSQPWQKCPRNEIRVTPVPAVMERAADFFGNEVCYFAVQTPHTEMLIEAVSTVERGERVLPPFSNSAPWEEAAALIRREPKSEHMHARLFVLDSPLAPADPALADYAKPSFPPGRPLLEAVNDLMGRIFGDFEFNAAATTVSSPILETLEKRQGVCQDFAHLGIGCLRSLGLPARYVSGYIETQPPPGKPKLAGADMSHAWFAVFAPDTGWVDFDPTNNQTLQRHHITTAWGRDYGDVAPVKGVTLGQTGHDLEVSVDVVPIE